MANAGTGRAEAGNFVLVEVNAMRQPSALR